MYPHSHAFNVKRIISHSNLELVHIFFSLLLRYCGTRYNRHCYKTDLLQEKKRKKCAHNCFDKQKPSAHSLFVLCTAYFYCFVTMTRLRSKTVEIFFLLRNKLNRFFSKLTFRVMVRKNCNMK